MRLVTMMVRSVAVVVLVVALQACAAPQGMPDQSAVAALDAQLAAESEMVLVLPQGASWLECATGPSKSEPVVIGPTGGEVGVGKHLLVIRPGTLTETATFRMMDQGSANGQLIIRSEPKVDFSPAQPAELTLSFSDCEISVENPTLHAKRYVTRQNPEDLDEFVDAVNQTVIAELHDLSTYVLVAM